MAVDVPAAVRAELARWARTAASSVRAAQRADARPRYSGRHPPARPRWPADPRAPIDRRGPDSCGYWRPTRSTLTLCFLGNQPVGEIEALGEVLAAACVGNPAGRGAPRSARRALAAPAPRPRCAVRSCTTMTRPRAGGPARLGRCRARRGHRARPRQTPRRPGRLGPLAPWRSRFHPHVTVARLRPGDAPSRARPPGHAPDLVRPGDSDALPLRGSRAHRGRVRGARHPRPRGARLTPPNTNNCFCPERSLRVCRPISDSEDSKMPATTTTRRRPRRPATRRAERGALTQIEREFGKGSVMRMGDEGAQVRVTPRFPQARCRSTSRWGSGRHRAGLHRRGLRPRVLGKTTLIYHVLAGGPEAGGGVRVHRRPSTRWTRCTRRRSGWTSTELLVSQPDYGEQALEIADMLVRSGAVDVVAIDSVAALTPRVELRGPDGRPDGLARRRG